MRVLLVASAIGLLAIGRAASAGPMSIGEGVTATVAVDLINVTTTVSNITNTLTGITADDFHLSYIQGTTVIRRYDYTQTSAIADFKMNGPVAPGGVLTLANGNAVSLVIDADVGVIDAWWTDKDGNPIPEPAMLPLSIAGFAMVVLRGRRSSPGAL